MSTQKNGVGYRLFTILAMMMFMLATAQASAITMTEVRDNLEQLKMDSAAYPLSDTFVRYLSKALTNMNSAIDARNIDPSANIESKMEKAAEMLDEYRGNVMVADFSARATEINGYVKAFKENPFTGLTLLIGDPAAGKLAFDSKLCYACHGNNGMSGPVGIDITHEAGAILVQAMIIEAPHAGVMHNVSDQDLYDIAAFLNAGGVITPTPLKDFSDPSVCRTCHPRQYEQWETNLMSYGGSSPVFSALEAFANKIPLMEGGRPKEDPITHEWIPSMALARKAVVNGAVENPPSDMLCQTCHNPIDGARQYPDGFNEPLSFDPVTNTEAQNPFPVNNAEHVFGVYDSNNVMVLPPDNKPVKQKPLRDYATSIGYKGISCDYCHQISGPDTSTVTMGRFGDGVANISLILTPGDKYGPLAAPITPNPIHGSIQSPEVDAGAGPYLSSSKFCAGCHDVRLAGTDKVIDPMDPTKLVPTYVNPLTGLPEDFRRLEDLYSEWNQGPYGLEYGGNNTTCQDCHMSNYPNGVPGEYPTDRVAIYPRPEANPTQRVSTHYFTGVDIPLDPAFPGLTVQNPLRTGLLQKAAAMDVTAINNAGTLEVDVAVTNVGSGHAIPSGFSQERQLWIELTVTDTASNTVLYQSGHLEDRDLDGRLNDEDLQNLEPELYSFQDFINDPTLWDNAYARPGKLKHLVNGPDHRDETHKLGLVNFGNEFISYKPDASGHYEEEEEFLPFYAEHMNNDHSIQPTQTKHGEYHIPLAGPTGPLEVKARLLYRPFPPRFLRFLSENTAEFGLITEATVDRNEIVEMVGPTTTVVNP